MGEVMSALLMLLALGVVLLALPVGIAIAIDWTPATTDAILTGIFAVCGGGVALAALGIGLGAGVRLMAGSRSREREAAPPRYPVVPARPVDPYQLARAERARIQAEREYLRLEADRRALLAPAPPVVLDVQERAERPPVWQVLEEDDLDGSHGAYNGAGGAW